MKKAVITLCLSLIVISGLVATRVPKNDIPAENQQGQVLSQTKEITLYYGSTCPYCIEVEKWLEENPEIKESSGLVAKEVYENQENNRELTEKAIECEIEGGVGVPFLYDSGQCIVGSQPIINHLTENYQ